MYESNKSVYNSNKTLPKDNEPSVMIEVDGTQRWYLNKKLHRDDDLPAEVYTDGTQRWYKNGKLHRDSCDLPAVIYANGARYWYINGKLHRDHDLPAIIDADGSQHWYLNGIQHRDSFDLPAVIYANGTQYWYLNGKLHRENNVGESLPVVIYADGTQWCYLNENSTNVSNVNNVRITESKVNIPDVWDDITYYSPNYSTLSTQQTTPIDDDFFDDFYDDIFSNEKKPIEKTSDFSVKSRRHRPKLTAVPSTVDSVTIDKVPLVNQLPEDSIAKNITNIDANVNSIYTQTSSIYSMIDIHAAHIASLSTEVRELKDLLKKMEANDYEMMMLLNDLHDRKREHY